MGVYHIVSVSEDALSLNIEQRSELEKAVGEAVVTVCVDPKFGHLRGPNLERVKTQGVLNCGNAVRHVSEVHHTESAVFFWSRSFLRGLDELSPDELNEVRRQVEAAAARVGTGCA